MRISLRSALAVVVLACLTAILVRRCTRVGTESYVCADCASWCVVDLGVEKNRIKADEFATQFTSSLRPSRESCPHEWLLIRDATGRQGPGHAGWQNVVQLMGVAERAEPLDREGLAELLRWLLRAPMLRELPERRREFLEIRRPTREDFRAWSGRVKASPTFP